MSEKDKDNRQAYEGIQTLLVLAINIFNTKHKESLFRRQNTMQLNSVTKAKYESLLNHYNKAYFLMNDLTKEYMEWAKKNMKENQFNAKQIDILAKDVLEYIR